MNDIIYLDYNATTPIAPEVATAMEPYLRGHFGNPSSSHRYGLEARWAVEKAREQVAILLGCHPDEIIFTSGGTESNNAAIRGVAMGLRDKGRHIITSTIEHPAVGEVCRFLEMQGFRITYVPVDDTGIVDPTDVERAICDETILVTVMHANNEIGTIEPIEEIARIARGHGIVVHSDGAQSVGKIATKVDALGVDLFSVAGHKLYAPKGIGALYIRRGVELTRFMIGADHEHNRRAGTENVLEIVGFGRAAELAQENLNRYGIHLRALRDRLFDRLVKALPDMRLNGHPEKRLPNTLSVSFPNIEANQILDEMTDVAASAGAACHADKIDISHVMQAIGAPEHVAMGTVRFSVGRETTDDDIDRAARRIVEVVGGLRATDEAARIVPLGNGDLQLTRYTRGMGCACKIRSELLEGILEKFPGIDHDNVLVGIETFDDAAVYRLSSELAIVATVDFFTPIVDDPKSFGAIAAANALSDVYAMGGRPLFALNLVGFPSRRLPLQVLQSILEGAREKAEEAGIVVVGGHSVEDLEPKFGWAVTGMVHPDRILRNSGARVGDRLVLTKPIGTGIIATAAKRGAAGTGAVRDAIATMAELNRTAATALEQFAVHACTDVTGFGLVGHLLEMATASGVAAELWVNSVPVLNEALECAQAGVVPGGTKDNLDHAGDCVAWSENVSLPERYLLCDAQTSGGLLISLPERDASSLLTVLSEKGVGHAALVGKITGETEETVTIIRGQ